MIIRVAKKADCGEELSQEQTNVEESSGNFTDLIEEIITMKKPLITHNGLLDILHLYSSFVGPLQEKASDFKKDFSANFPVIYDTKYIVSSSNILLPEDKMSTSL